MEQALRSQVDRCVFHNARWGGRCNKLGSTTPPPGLKSSRAWFQKFHNLMEANTVLAFNLNLVRLVFKSSHNLMKERTQCLKPVLAFNLNLGYLL